jgi:glycosyltransferase involved in cell wall biosynthesis
MKKSNILHLTYDMRIGGTETVIKNLVEGINQDRYNVKILCIEPNIGPFGQQLVVAGYKVATLGWTGGFDKSLFSQIRIYLINNSVDVLHCHQYTPWFYGAVASAFTKTKVIFTEHGRFHPDRSSWKRRIINPCLMLLTDHVTAISEATKLALNKYEFIRLNKIKVIYNGVKPLQSDANKALAVKKKLNIHCNSLVFGTVARLDPIKNQELMIRAFSEVLNARENCILLLVGDGDEKTYLESLVNELKIDKKVIFTGYISSPVDYIVAIDVFLLSSFSEGTSMTLLEAMSLKKPCVVTDAGGNKEVIEHEVNGLVTKNNELSEFTSAMLELSMNDEKRQEMGHNGKVRFDSIFSAENMVNAFCYYYSENK